MVEGEIVKITDTTADGESYEITVEDDLPPNLKLSPRVSRRRVRQVPCKVEIEDEAEVTVVDDGVARRDVLRRIGEAMVDAWGSEKEARKKAKKKAAKDAKRDAKNKQVQMLERGWKKAVKQGLMLDDEEAAYLALIGYGLPDELSKRKPRRPWDLGGRRRSALVHGWGQRVRLADERAKKNPLFSAGEISEADTKFRYIDPVLRWLGWPAERIRQEFGGNDTGRADYLFLTPNGLGVVAVLEVKKASCDNEGLVVALEQAWHYAKGWGCPAGAFASNGRELLHLDGRGIVRVGHITDFPGP